MKNRIAAIVLLAMGSISMAYGQASVSIGIKAGLNFASLNTSSFSAAYESRTGYHAGAFVNVKLTKIAIQPEVIFSQQGSTVKLSTGQSIEQNFNYVNIPVLLKFYLISGLNLQAGPQFGFLTSATGA